MKRIASIVLIIGLLFTLTYAAELSGEQKAELKKFGIMVGDGNGNLRLDDAITRAEAVKMICAAGNLKYDNADKNCFPDVAKEHWAYDYICAAKANGIVVGDENGNFNPENTITNEEIVKMIVCLTGHGVIAEANGGYPAGYSTEAAKYGITEGLALKVNSPATRNDVGIMIYNALDVPLIVEQERVGGDVEYSLMDGENGVMLITLRNAFEGE